MKSQIAPKKLLLEIVKNPIMVSVRHHQSTNFYACAQSFFFFQTVQKV